MTSAPLSTAHSIPSATSRPDPDPVAPSTFTGMILHVQHTPATPSPLLDSAAAKPATDVPWPSSSRGLVFSALPPVPALEYDDPLRLNHVACFATPPVPLPFGQSGLHE